jgi:predicted O-methyltransferase YrrM
MHPLKSLKIRSRRALGHRLDDLAWKVLWGGERVPMAFPPGHYYSTIPSRRDVDEQPRIEIVAIDLRLDEQLALLAKLNAADPTGPRFESFSWTHGPNQAFPNTDAAIYQAMIRYFQPTRVIEVGCGWSTGALFDAGAAQHVTLIEPYPDRVREVLSPEDLGRCDLIELRLQDVPLSTFQALNSSDVLFIDSTHVTKLGSDVNRIMFEILPALASGVIVHFHDVLYPFEYLDIWVRQGRAWNEAYLLRAFLEYNDAFEIVLWVDMLQSMGYLAGDGVSIWLQKA